MKQASPPAGATHRCRPADASWRRNSENGDRRSASTPSSAPDLRRAVETAEIAFGATVAIHPDPRLREYDYGTMTGVSAEQIHSERPARVDTSFPEGESLRDVVNRVRSFLADLAQGSEGKCVVVVGHGATKLALDHLLGGLTLEDAASQPFTWEPIPPSYRYVLEA